MPPGHPSDKHFIFWQRWLLVTSILFACFGILFGLDIKNPVFELYDKSVAKIFWDTSTFPVNMNHYREFAWGSIGATIACCYILLSFIAAVPFRKMERWSYIAICVAFTVWAIIDSAISIRFHVNFQVWLINCGSIATKALPLVFTWKYFFRKVV